MDKLLAEAVRAYPVLYDKASKGCKDRNKEDLSGRTLLKRAVFTQVKITHVGAIKVFAQQVSCSVSVRITNMFVLLVLMLMLMS